MASGSVVTRQLLPPPTSERYDADMGPGEFEDVSYRIEEEPEPPRRPRRRGALAIAAVAALLCAGAVAAGASALTGSSDAGKAPAATQSREFHSFARDGRRHHGCHRMEGRAAGSTVPALSPQD